MTNRCVIYVGPLSGAFAWVGQDLAAAVRLAAAESPESIDVLTVDSATDDSLGELRIALGRDRVLGVVGPTFSSSVELLGELLDAADVLFLTPVATKASLADHGWTHFFRMVAPDRARVPAVVNLLVGQLGLERVGVVSDQQASVLADAVASGLGASTASRLILERGASDIAPAVGMFADARIDGVYFAGEVLEAVRLLTELSAAGLDVPFVGDDGIYTDRFIAAARNLSEGVLVVAPAMAAGALPSFDSQFAHREGRTPTAFALEAYLAAKLLLHGVDRSTRLAPEDLHAGIEVDGLSFAFGPSGEPTPQLLYCHTVVDGRWRQTSVLTVEPPAGAR